ncbi:MAG: NAD-dependent DNA ligase LigA [Treponemataceae bacterium]|nr:NAD-dependent DNA ligase LigA [Treponemataceae bacterium]
MKDATDSTRINELVGKIKKYQKSYYQGEGEISDAEFDSLWDELKILDPENPILQKIGSDLSDDSEEVDGFDKAEHLIPMGSQEKAANPAQFLSWAEKHDYDEYLVEYKLDGASLELQYQSGIFSRAVTRGDGHIGDDITRNVRKMKGVVERLPFPFTGGVRGEVIMSHKVHDTLFSDKANCRNAANGLMKRKNGEGSEYLEVICYDAYFTETGGHPYPFHDEAAKMEWLSSSGFNTVPVEYCKTAQDVIEYRAKVMEKRSSLDYDIDGLVIKNKEIDLEDARRNRPDKQIAFKFSLEEAVSTVRRVIWNENGVTYTPIAEFDRVELAGTKVSRASLANPDTIKSLGLKIGSHVVVTKRGEIIPKIEYVIQEKEGELPESYADMPLFSGKEDSLLTEVAIPDTCGTCGEKLKNEGSRLYCPNPACPKRIHHQLEKWISVIDIRDFGSTLIKNMFDSGDLKSISDIYSLTEEKLTPYFLNDDSIEKDKVSLGARKVLASIEKSRTMSLSKFIAGLDIEGIGETMIDKLIDAGFDSLDKILAAKEEDIASVYMFAEITAHTLVAGLKENLPEIHKLIDGQIIELTKAAGLSGLLAGKSFCFTGELYTMKRSQAEAKVKALGASVKSSVVKDLSYLVTNDTTSGSSKNKKAAQLGIPVIDEKTFLSLLGE